MESIPLIETKYILKSLVISSPFAMTIDKLNKDYHQTMGTPIPFRKLGFRNLQLFLYSISDTLLLTHGRNPLVYVTPSGKTQHMEKLSSIKKNVTTMRNNDIKKKYPVVYAEKYQSNIVNEGVQTNTTQNSLIIGNKEVNKDIDQMKLQKISAEIKSNIKCDKTIVINGKRDINKVDTSIDKKSFFSEPLNFITEAVPNINKNDAIFLLDFPKDSVKFGTKIECFQMPLELKDGDVFAIFITEIHNPYKFWFHIAKQNDELDEMMTGLQYFYENCGREFIMESSNIIPGLICAAPYSGLWHRAEIIGLLMNGKVKVCFFDYGTVYNVPVKCVRYLSTQFSKLNKQALRGCLSHIRPSDLRWSRDSTYAFLDMVADKLLYAKVTKILREDNIINILLTDTNYERDFQINNALILKGHAKLYSEAVINPFDKFHYPTFKMLENGEYPTFHELGNLLAKGIDYEEREYNNIMCDVYAKKCTLEEYLQKLTSCHIKRKN